MAIERVAQPRPAITSPTDRLALGVFGGLAAVATLGDPHPTRLLVLLAGAAAATYLVAAWATVSSLGTTVHEFLSPYAAVVCAFELSGPIIERATQRRWDVPLQAVDVRLFDGLFGAWHGVLGRPWWLTDTASIAYVGFYALPLLVGIALHRNRADFARFCFAVEVAFFVPYLGYVFIPAYGPRFVVAQHGQASVAEALGAFVRSVEINTTDAFPSGHTTVALVVLAVAWPLLPRWRAPLVAAVAAIVFSTVYLAYHYVVDVAAGVLVAAMMPLLLPVLRRACSTPRYIACSGIPA